MQNESIDSDMSYKKIFDSAPVLMGVTDLEDNDIRHVVDNEAARNFFDVDADKPEGWLATELGVPADVLNVWIKNYKKAEETKSPVYFEYQHPSQEPKTFSVVVSYIGKNSKGQSRFAYSVQDVTKDRLAKLDAELELRSKELRYQFIVEGVKDHAIIQMDSDGIIIDWNRGAENIFLWKKEEIIGRSGSVIFTPEDRDQKEDIQELKRAVDEGRSEDKRYHLKKDGSRFYGNGSLNSLKNEQGKLLGFVKVLRDDSEKKIAEEQLQLEKIRAEIAEERFKAATMETNVGVWEYEFSTQKFWRSESHAKIYGIEGSVSDWGREKISKHIHEDDRANVLEEFNEALKNHHSFRKEYRVVWSDGSLHWLNASGKWIENKLVGTVIDVTERKIAEERLEASKKDLEDVFMQAPVPLVILTGPDFYFKLANPPYEKLIGRKAQGRHIFDVFTKDEIDLFLPLLENVYKTGKPYIGKELPLNLPDGSQVMKNHFIDLGYYPYIDQSGTIKGVLAVVNDVTEQVKARKFLEESESRFRNLANSLPIIIWTATPEFTVDWYNEWWFKYLDMPKGTTWENAELAPMHPDDVKRTWGILEEAVKSGKDLTMEQRFRRGSDGMYRWHLVRGIPIKDELGNIVKWVGANTDIHDQKVLLQQLEDERDLREQFVATLSHDLRTPLTAAKMNAQMITKRYNDSERVIKSSIKIDENLNRADAMIRDLLDASRLKAGEKLQMEITNDCNLRNVISDVVEELSTIHGDRFKIEIEDDVIGNWSCSGIRRILENLCSNAIKYGSTVSPVRVKATRNEACAILEVHNKGNPIPPDALKALFKPFKRIESAETGKHKGWGLGLTLVKGLAEAHGGSISVTSNSEEGTTFIVKLPLP